MSGIFHRIKKSGYFIRKAINVICWDEKKEQRVKAPQHTTLTVTSTSNISSLSFSDFQGATISIGAQTIVSGSVFFHRPAALTIGDRTFVGGGANFHIAESVFIGNDVMISWNCTIIDTNMHSLKFSERSKDVLMTIGQLGYSLKDKNWDSVITKPITINNKVWIGLNSIILKGVTLGEGCVIGAGSVVATDIPPWTLAVGNPAKIIRQLPREV